MSRVDYFSAPDEHGFPHGTKVILRTGRGTEMGTIVASPRRADLAALESRPGQVLRAATAEDMERQKQIEENVEPTELKECVEEVGKHELPMRLLAVEHIFGGEKIVFYFMSDGRVDFRKLVRDMARRYRTRIEFRQIGVRDEARLLAEYEHCGQPLCCRQFLRGLEPVTMRMAKLQKATLDPAKISGRCGRLMCCLRYEEEVYAELRSKLPSRGVYVLTDEIAGQVLSGDIISQRVVVNTGQRRVTVGVSDIRKVSRQPLEPPAPKIPAEPRHEPAVAVREAPPGGKRRESGRKPKASTGQKDRPRKGGGTGEGRGEGEGRASGGKRRGGRRRRRSRGRRGRSGGKGGSGGGASGGKKGGNAPSGSKP
jgi:cell fate regulator YaaT (PSP1 superfamily)